MSSQKGFSLIEVVIASAIIAAVLSGLTWVSQTSFRMVSDSTLEARAYFLLEEGVEAVRVLRDQSWSSNLAPATSRITFYPVFTGGNWTLSTTDPGLIDGVFSRRVIFSDVYRKTADDDIVDITAPDSKALDPGTKKMTLRVSWGPVTKEKSLSTYITNVFQN